MPRFDIALILTVESSTYEEALQAAEDLAEGVSQDEENISAVTNYERDHEGQRVLYLHDERNL